MNNIKPFRYPLWIELFFILFIIASIYLLANSAMFFRAVRSFNTAKRLAAEKEWDRSYEYYARTLKIFPKADKVKISFATMIWQNDDPEDDEIGLSVISGVNLSDSEWKKIRRVLPPKYEELFTVSKGRR